MSSCQTPYMYFLFSKHCFRKMVPSTHFNTLQLQHKIEIFFSWCKSEPLLQCVPSFLGIVDCNNQRENLWCQCWIYQREGSLISDSPRLIIWIHSSCYIFPLINMIWTRNWTINVINQWTSIKNCGNLFLPCNVVILIEIDGHKIWHVWEKQ